MIVSVFFTDNSLLEYETHKRGRIYLRRLSGSECSAIASEVLLGTSKLSGSTDTSEESNDTKGRKKNKKDTFYFNRYSYYSLLSLNQNKNNTNKMEYSCIYINIFSL